MKTNIVTLLRIAGLPEPQTEYPFASNRKWRFDYAWPDLRLAVEMEGGHWRNGRHVRGKGYTNDCEKYNEAQILGWKVLRFTSDMVADGRALAQLQCAARLEGCH